MDMFRRICTRRFCTLRQLKDKIYDNPETINFNETKEKLVSLEKEMKTPHIGDFSTGECVIFYTIFVAPLIFGTYASTCACFQTYEWNKIKRNMGEAPPRQMDDKGLSPEEIDMVGTINFYNLISLIC